MKRLTTLALLACLAGVAIATGPTQSDKKTFDMLYRTLEKQARTFDIDGTMALCTQDFVLKGLDGKTIDLDGFKKLLEGIRDQSHKMTSVKMTIHKLEVKGNMATVWEDTVMKSNSIDKKHPKRIHKWVDTNTSVDHWVKTDKGWMLSGFDLKKDRTTLDGKPTTGLTG